MKWTLKQSNDEGVFVGEEGMKGWIGSRYLCDLRDGDKVLADVF